MEYIKLFEQFTQQAIEKSLSVLKAYDVLEDDTYDIDQGEITIYMIKDKQFDYFLDNQIIIELDMDGEMVIWNIEYEDHGDKVDFESKKEVKKYLLELSDKIAKENIMVNWGETDEDYEITEKVSPDLSDVEYTINKDEKGKPVSITCHTCKKTSYSVGDIKHKYCGKCHKYHDQ